MFFYVLVGVDHNDVLGLFILERMNLAFNTVYCTSTSKNVYGNIIIQCYIYIS